MEKRRQRSGARIRTRIRGSICCWWSRGCIRRIAFPSDLSILTQSFRVAATYLVNNRFNAPDNNNYSRMIAFPPPTPFPPSNRSFFLSNRPPARPCSLLFYPSTSASLSFSYSLETYARMHVCVRAARAHWHAGRWLENGFT